MAEPVTIVALGDSLTAGYGLADQSQGFVPVLEGWLKAKGHDSGSLRAGWDQGKKANLHRGVAQERQASLAYGGGQ